MGRGLPLSRVLVSGTAVAGDGSNPVTIEMKITYLDPAPPGRLTAHAVIRRRGSRITIVEADITDKDERFVAHAIATFTTVPRPAPP